MSASQHNLLIRSEQIRSYRQVTRERKLRICIEVGAINRKANLSKSNGEIVWSVKSVRDPEGSRKRSKAILLSYAVIDPIPAATMRWIASLSLTFS